MKTILISFLLLAGLAICQLDCKDNSECPLGYFCAKAEGDCTGLGTCTKKPTVCPDVWDPVCGCDGQTYANACYAAYFGINVAYKGECPSLCSDNGDCPEGYYCAKAEGDCNGSGTCTKNPTVCPDVWDPVCGCNFLTYGNACEAAAAGVNVRYAGPCKAACVNPPLADLNGDCWVDMQDLALFARDWLSCGLDAPEYCFDVMP